MQDHRKTTRSLLCLGVALGTAGTANAEVSLWHVALDGSRTEDRNSVCSSTATRPSRS